MSPQQDDSYIVNQVEQTTPMPLFNEAAFSDSASPNSAPQANTTTQQSEAEARRVAQQEIAAARLRNQQRTSQQPQSSAVPQPATQRAATVNNRTAPQNRQGNAVPQTPQPTMQPNPQYQGQTQYNPNPQPPYQAVPNPQPRKGSRWSEVKEALGWGKDKAVTPVPFNPQTGLVVEPPVIGGVSIWTNYGACYFTLAFTLIVWVFSAASWIGWIGGSDWGGFIYTPTGFLGSWPVLLLETLFVVGCMPRHRPKTDEEWALAIVWFIVVCFDVLTNYDRVYPWLPSFEVPAFHWHIQDDLGRIPVSFLISVAIAYLPERLFWNRIRKMRELRYELRILQAINEYRNYQADLYYTQALQSLKAGQTQQNNNTNNYNQPTHNGYYHRGQRR